jgi:tetratricopeptide (TPR) repeat protein
MQPKTTSVLPILLVLFFFSNVSAQSFAEKIKNADSLYQMKDYAHAKKKYAAALGDTAKNGPSWNRLGYSCYNLGELDAAMVAYNKALLYGRAAPLRASVYSRMARINGSRNKKTEAFANLDSAINNGYYMYYELDSLKDFNPIREMHGLKSCAPKYLILPIPALPMGKPGNLIFG